VNNVNEIYLISHALLETGNGSSKLANGVLVSSVDGKLVPPRVVYNTYGIGAYDNCALQCGSEYAYKMNWFTSKAAIVGGAAFINKNYVSAGQDTLYKMRWNPAAPGTHQYATDIGWAAKQTSRIYGLYSLLDTYTLTFDVPVYSK
jgi:beta-N-acetylglucosaminidase